MRKIIAAVLFTVALAPLFSQEKSIPFTQADRDRLLRVEAKIEGQDKRIDDMNRRFDDVNKRIDEMKDSITQLESNIYSLFMWGFGIVIMSIMGLIGFIIYDRRTTLAPVERKTEKILKVLREFGEINPEIRESLSLNNSQIFLLQAQTARHL